MCLAKFKLKTAVNTTTFINCAVSYVDTVSAAQVVYKNYNPEGKQTLRSSMAVHLGLDGK